MTFNKPWALLGVAAFGAFAADATTFRISRAALSARVDHPFSVVVLDTEQVKGTLQIDPMNLAHAPSVDVSVATASLSPGGMLGHYLERQLQPETSQQIRFVSAQAETLAYLSEQKPVQAFEAIFRGTLQVAGGAGTTKTSLKCRYDAPAVHCQVFSRFPLSAVGLVVPHILWVKAKDEATVEGEADFVPQEGTP
jgi:hypothetical protein